MSKFKLAGGFTVCCIGLALLANSVQAAPRFVGRLIITAPSGTCTFSGNPVGSRRKAQFAPANVGTNGPDSSLSLFSDGNAENLKLVNASFDTVLRPVVHTGIYDIAYSLPSVSVRFSSQTPATILPTTNFVDVVGVIRGWQGGPLCNLTVRISFARAAS